MKISIKTLVAAAAAREGKILDFVLLSELLQEEEGWGWV